MCYLLSWLNRRVRNRTHGGVRGRENLFNFPSYSIDVVEISVSVRKYSGAVLELDYEFFNVTRGEVCTVASSKHCFTRDGKLVSLKREIPELDVLFRDCAKGE